MGTGQGADRDDLCELANQVLAARPFSQLLGATLSGVGPGRAELKLSITPRDQAAARVRPWRCDQLPRGQLDHVCWRPRSRQRRTPPGTRSTAWLQPPARSSSPERRPTDSIGKRETVCRTEISTTGGHHEQRCALAREPSSPSPERRGVPRLGKSLMRTRREPRGSLRDQR